MIQKVFKNNVDFCLEIAFLKLSLSLSLPTVETIETLKSALEWSES